MQDYQQLEWESLPQQDESVFDDRLNTLLNVLQKKPQVFIDFWALHLLITTQKKLNNDEELKEKLY